MTQTPPEIHHRPIIAIDPGKKGGWVWGDGSPENTKAAKMPPTPQDVSEMLGDIVSEFGEQPTVYMELVGGFISGVRLPGSAMFNFGRNVGILEGAIASHKLRLVLTRPLQWQGAMSTGKKAGRTTTQWKNHLKAAAQNLFPAHKITLDTSDAFLIYYAAAHKKI